MKGRLSKKARFEQSQFILPMFWMEVIFPKDWTEEEIIDLHEYLIEVSLKDLLESGSDKAKINRKIEVLEWVLAPDEEIVKIKGKSVLIDNTIRPFSFHTCCRVKGTDPEELRNLIFNKLDTRFKNAIAAYKKAA